MEIKDIMANLNKKVRYKESDYIMSGSTVRKLSNGKVIYTVELFDKNTNTLYTVRLEDVVVI